MPRFPEYWRGRRQADLGPSGAASAASPAGLRPPFLNSGEKVGGRPGGLVLDTYVHAVPGGRPVLSSLDTRGEHHDICNSVRRRTSAGGGHRHRCPGPRPLLGRRERRDAGRTCRGSRSADPADRDGPGDVDLADERCRVRGRDRGQRRLRRRQLHPGSVHPARLPVSRRSSARTSRRSTRRPGSCCPSPTPSARRTTPCRVGATTTRPAARARRPAPTRATPSTRSVPPVTAPRSTSVATSPRSTARRAATSRRSTRATMPCSRGG